jgi:hypothetical protein
MQSVSNNRTGKEAVTLFRVTVKQGKNVPVVTIEGEYDDGEVFSAQMAMHSEGTYIALAHFCESIDYRPDGLDDFKRDASDLTGRRFFVTRQFTTVDGLQRMKTYYSKTDDTVPAPSQAVSAYDPVTRTEGETVETVEFEEQPPRWYGEKVRVPADDF